MYTPIDRLPQFNPGVCAKYQRRWREGEGPSLREKILGMIKAGAGEDFLQWEFEQEQLGFLEDMHDLKGFDIFSEDIKFPDDDTFEAIDFSFAEFYHSKFENAVFYCNFAFSRIYNCEFRGCIFSFNHFYGSNLEKVRFVDCDFIENDSFTNCDFRDVVFANCFVTGRLFFDCRFDENVRVADPVETPLRVQRANFEMKQQADVFKGIKEAYQAGGASDLARQYLFRQMQSVTRHNTDSALGKASGYAKEYFAGYGVRPSRVLAIMLVTLLISTLIFSVQFDFGDALVLAAGALFTFGARSEVLVSLGTGYRFVYIATAFLGVSLVALFVTVWANIWFREQ